MRHARDRVCLITAVHAGSAVTGRPARAWALLVAIVALVLPAVALSQDSGALDDLRSEWRAVQSSKDRATHRRWWSAMSAERLQEFVQADVDINQANYRRWTPLHSAARYSAQEAVVSVLLEAGADVNARDRAGDTPLHWAAAGNANVEIIEAILSAGADVNATDRFGWTPIHTAAESNSNPDVVKALLDAGANHKRRAYFLLFSPRFLLKHNADMSDADREQAFEWLKSAS